MMKRRTPDPLPAAIPQSFAAPVSTYFDPRLPRPRRDNTTEELLAFNDALVKFGFVFRKKEKEQLQGEAVVDAGEWSPDRLRNLADEGLLPELEGTEPGPAVTAGDITAEEISRNKAYEERHLETRQQFLDLRGEGLPQNGDPYYRGIRANIIGQNIARAYRTDLELRLSETYTLDPTTGKPLIDYSDLSAEVNEKYAPFLEALEGYGDEGYVIEKAKIDDLLARQAVLALNQAEIAQTKRDWAVGNVTYMVDSFLDGQFDSGEFAGLQERFRSVRHEFGDIQEEFVSQLEAASEQILRIERDGLIKPGEGLELAIDLLETLVPESDGENGVILGTPIKNDMALQARVSDLKESLEDKYAQELTETKARERTTAQQTLYPVALAAATAPGADKESVFKALTVAANADGLTLGEQQAVNDLLYAVQYHWDGGENSSGWDETQRREFKSEYSTLVLSGATDEEVRAFLVESGVVVGDPDLGRQLADKYRQPTGQTLSQREIIDPQLRVARQDALSGNLREQESSPGFFDDQAARYQGMIARLNGTSTTEEALEVLEQYSLESTELNKEETNRLDASHRAFNELVRGFRLTDAYEANEAERDSLPPGVYESRVDRLGRTNSEHYWKTQISTQISKAVEREMLSNPLWADDISNGYPDRDASAQASLISERIHKNAMTLWDESKGAVPPAVAENQVMQSATGAIDTDFSGWYVQKTSSDPLTGEAQVQNRIVSDNTTQGILDSQASSVPLQVQAQARLGLDTYSASGLHVARYPDEIIQGPTPRNKYGYQGPRLLPPQRSLESQGEFLAQGGEESERTLADQRGSDEYSLQWMLKSTSPPAPQEGVCVECLTGTHAEGSKHAQSRTVRDIPRDQLDATAITLGRTFLISTTDIVSGEWTIPAGESVPDFTKWDIMTPVQTQMQRIAGKDTTNIGRVKGLKRFTHYDMQRFGMQSPYTIDISSARMGELGMPSLSPTKNFGLRTQEDFTLLFELANPSTEGTVTVKGIEIPKEEAQRRFLAAYGYRPGTVADPAALSAENLHQFVSQIAWQQVSLGKHLGAPFTTE